MPKGGLSSLIAIGEKDDFEFFNESYDYVNVNANGWIGWNSENENAWLNSDLPSPNAPRLPYLVIGMISIQIMKAGILIHPEIYIIMLIKNVLSSGLIMWFAGILMNGDNLIFK